MLRIDGTDEAIIMIARTFLSKNSYRAAGRMQESTVPMTGKSSSAFWSMSDETRMHQLIEKKCRLPVIHVYIGEQATIGLFSSCERQDHYYLWIK